MIYRICGFIGFKGTRLDNRRLFLRHAEAKVKNLRIGWHTCRKLHKLNLVPRVLRPWERGWHKLSIYEKQHYSLYFLYKCIFNLMQDVF